MATKIIAGLALLFALGAGAFYYSEKNTVNTPADTDEQVFCTMDALMCPDGSGVGRVGPACAFQACPQQASFVGELQSTTGGFQLVFEPTDATMPMQEYTMPLIVEDADAFKNFVGKRVVVRGTFTHGSTYNVESMELATEANTTHGIVALGETKVINGVSITLNAVTQDSRCPIDAVCIQAGWVEADVTLSRGPDTKTVTLDSRETYPFTIFDIAMISIAPARMASEPFDDNAYRITFEVTLRR